MTNDFMPSVTPGFKLRNLANPNFQVFNEMDSGSSLDVVLGEFREQLMSFPANYYVSGVEFVDDCEDVSMIRLVATMKLRGDVADD